MLENLSAKELMESLSTGKVLWLFRDAVRGKNILLAISTQRALAKRGEYYAMWEIMLEEFFPEGGKGLNLDSGDFCLVFGLILGEMKVDRIFGRLGKYLRAARERFEAAKHSEYFTRTEFVKCLEQDFRLPYAYGNDDSIYPDFDELRLSFSKALNGQNFEAYNLLSINEDLLNLGLKHRELSLVEYAVAVLCFVGRFPLTPLKLAIEKCDDEDYERRLEDVLARLEIRVERLDECDGVNVEVDYKFWYELRRKK